MMKTVTFGRHGQSESNVIKPEKVQLSRALLDQFRQRNTGDHRLTKTGVQDAKFMGQILGKLGTPFTLLTTSTFVRAQETLLHTGLRGRVEISPLIDERFTGDLEGLTLREATEKYPSSVRERLSKKTRWRPLNGESMRDVLTRTLLFIEQLKQVPGGNGHVLVVSHARVIAAYMWWAEQLLDNEVPGQSDTAGFTIRNGQVTQYGWVSESLRPTHKRVFVPLQEIDLNWEPLLQESRFEVADLERMVNKYPRLLL